MGTNLYNKTTDWMLIILINFMWATQVPVIRLIGARIDAVTVAFVPLLISTLLFLPVLAVENKRRGLKFRWKWKEIKLFILPAVTGIFVMQYAYTVGSRYTLAANAGIITLTIPVLVAILASVMLKEKLNPVRVVSFILAIVGVLVTSIPDLLHSKFDGQYLLGNLIFLFACCCCAFYNTYCKLLVDKGYSELEILVYCSVIASILCIPILLFVEPFSLQKLLDAGNNVIFGLMELGLIVYGISMLLFFSVLKRMDVTQAILGCYLLPFFIAILAILILDEKITPLMIVGGVVIMISTLMVTVYEERLMSVVRNWEKAKRHIKSKN